MSHQAGRNGGDSVSDWKDEPVAIQAGSLDAEEHEAAALAVSHRDAETADGSVLEPDSFDDAEVLSGDALSLPGPHILNPKVDIDHDVVTLAIQRFTASQRNGG